MTWYRWEHDALLLAIRVQPRASKDEMVTGQGDHLKIRIAAPPVDGKANAYLIEFLSGVFTVPKSNITILSGEVGRAKRIRIQAPRALPPFIDPPLKPAGK
ncbi:MAG: YggU family protein [Gammaproteobacteria bacterium]|nr:YggU family protein [Gammaproteobacteria bacterium]